MLKEFKEFALKGNVMDLAIGVIIGAAFSGIVKSMVDDIIMPIVGAITGGVDFSNYFVGLASAYGNFITAAVNFLIIAFVLFMVVRAINSMKRKEEEKPAPVATKPPEVEVLEEIRDLLAKK
ncbi:UNVERIFIED_CONTAM: hypothetical protein GTU68_001422 [Idotea baltica]|nr:hypothetical protein [Idotea baltica]